MERQNFCQKLYGIKQKAFRVTLEAILRKYIWEDTPPPLKIRQSSIWYAGSLGRWDEQLIDQASDVPSIIFFHNFLQNSLQKLFDSTFA